MESLSVVIPTLYGEEMLKRVVGCINANHPFLLEIIVVNNGNPYVVKGIDNIKVIQMPYNTGFAHAVNEGIKASKGNWVLILNDDMVFEKNTIDKLYNVVKNYGYDGYAFKIMNMNGEIESCGDAYNKDNRPYGLKNCDKEREILGPTGGFALYRRDILKENMYDENFFAYFEDIDLNVRLRFKGCRFLFLPDIEIYHEGSFSSSYRGQYSERKVFWMARNRIYLIYKNWHAHLIIQYFPYYMAGFFLSFFYHIKTGYWYSYIEGLLQGISTLYRIKREIKDEYKRIMKKIWDMR